MLSMPERLSQSDASDAISYIATGQHAFIADADEHEMRDRFAIP